MMEITLFIHGVIGLDLMFSQDILSPKDALFQGFSSQTGSVYGDGVAAFMAKDAKLQSAMDVLYS